MHECETCDREFVNWHAVCQHMNAVAHWGCDACNRTFWDQEAAEDHMEDYGHSLPFECEACNDRFATSQLARSHMDSANHWRIHWCDTCERGFQNATNLQMHLNSRTHRGSNLACPFCRRSFTTATGISAHLEAGACPNARNLNHGTILAEIRRRDPSHAITKKLLTYPGSTTTTVTSACWNGDGFECYLCHREFNSLRGLHQHVNSAAHRQNVYHCPGRSCFKEFTALAGLFNHLESETCGAMKFDTVQRNVGNFLTGRKTISFH